MAELLMSLIEKYPVISTVIVIAAATQGLATAITAITPTPVDDNIVKKVYKVIEWAAGVTNKTKQK